MTQPEFTEFLTRFHDRWGFKKLVTGYGDDKKPIFNPELVKKLKGHFFDYPQKSMFAAMQAYDMDNPDLDWRTFKLAALRDRVQEATEHLQAEFTWAPCDEVEFYADGARRQRYGLEEISLRDFALHILGKPRVPNDHERLRAQEVLKKMGVQRTITDVQRIQAENEQAYTRYREIDRQSKLELKRRTRERGKSEQEKQAASKDPKGIGDYARRAMKIIERQASEQE